MYGSRRTAAGKVGVAPHWLLAAAFFVPFSLYLFTLAPTVLNDDSAEYQMILPALGVAHPTGYPLYTLLGHLFTRIVPFGDMAYRVNLFSALTGAAAIVMVCILLRELNVSPLIALLGSLVVAVSSDFWTYATIAQTYALNSLLTSWALLAFVRYQKRSDGRSLIVLAFASGLGVAHHSMFWLFLPALALGVLIVNIRQRLLNLLSFVAVVPVFTLALLLYLYIPLRGEQLRSAIPGDVLGYPHVVTDGLLTPHYLGGWTNVVGGSFYASSTLGGAQVDWLLQIADYLYHLFLQFNVFTLLAVAFIVPVARHHTVLTSILIIAWLTNVIIVIRGVTAFNEPAGGLFAPTYLFAAILIALSAQHIAQRYSHRFAVGLLALLCLFNFGYNIASHNLREQTTYRETASKQLHETLPAAVILGAWSQVTPLHYMQIVEGVRRDVSVIHAPIADPIGHDLMRRAFDENRPLYVLMPSDGLSRIATRPE